MGKEEPGWRTRRAVVSAEKTFDVGRMLEERRSTVKRVRKVRI